MEHPPLWNSSENTDNHRESTLIPKKLVFVYIITITLLYIYIHHLVEKHGDFMSKYPQIDFLKSYKCRLKFDKCEDQILDGWGVARLLIFFSIGCIAPHSHCNILIFSLLSQGYIIAWDKPSRHILNPLLTMLGYSLGSVTCGGCGTKKIQPS